MRRITAFAAWCTGADRFGRGERRMRELAERFDCEFLRLSFDGWVILLVGPKGSSAFLQPQESIDVAIGPVMDGTGAESAASDRYLRIRCEGRILEISNDYVGSIPIFHSVVGDVVSNILPVVVGASGIGINDVDPQDLVGLLVLSHPVWDETAFRSIRVAPPDVNARFEPGHPPFFQRKNTLCAERRDVGARTAAADLAELNRELVIDGLDGHDVILPLSAGYDSRLILGVLGSSRFRQRLRTFTYGPEGSVDVEAARELAIRAGVQWNRIDLPCEFLDRHYLENVGAIFGGHLHFHGMYQFEFILQTLREFDCGGRIWTSGFMTGVPGGQHIGLLSGNGGILARMRAFSQSRVMPPDRLLAGAPFLSDGVERLRRRLQLAYDWIDADDDQRIVVCDLMTRQRHFISYYPRVFEWMVDERSPHMNPKWVNFFLGLPPALLRDRRLVEHMFTKEMPDLAGVISNSNGLRSPNGRGTDLLHFGSLVLTRLGAGKFLPRRFRKSRMDFDSVASAKAGPDGFWPAMPCSPEWEWLESLLPTSMLGAMSDRALRGDPSAIDWMSRIQAIAYDLRCVLE